MSDGWKKLETRSFKAAGGGGIRFALEPREKINIRVDFGTSKYGDGIYIERMEAF